MIDALADVKARGYTEDFSIESSCLYCGDLDLRLTPEEFHVDEFYRFEGDSNPEDSAVLYAISSSSGVKGTVVDSYGMYAENMNLDMAQKISNHPY
ncbi:phosphoribosylpyrophosphate synthetase [Chitinophaga sp. SYP-B3965]|nr:phosphoribosylpyrophosphate synthetase [Chitinophaga sp. SYP-B3965]